MTKNLQKQLPASHSLLLMLENSKIQTSVTRKVLSQHCTGVARGKMRGEQNCPTLSMTKVVGARKVYPRYERKPSAKHEASKQLQFPLP